MNGFCKLAAALAVVTTIGCATQVTVTPTHRENMAAQSKELAIAARELEGIMRGRNVEGGKEEAVQAVIDFHCAGGELRGHGGFGAIG